MAQRTCWIDDCESPRIARGLCNAHYRRWRRTPDGAIQPEPPTPKPTCSVNGCNRTTKARGWCKKHYKRWCDHGSTDLPERPPPTMKTCSECGLTAPAGEFPPKRSRCHSCRSRQNRSWREANRDQLSARQREWRIVNAERLKEYQARNAARIAEAARERYAANPEAKAAVRRAWRAKNRERDRENQRRWRASHRSELAAREMDRYWATRTPPESVALIEARIAYYGGKCWICRTADYEHLDHVKPLAKGGIHIPSNLRPACARCNQSKHDRWPFERP